MPKSKKPYVVLYTLEDGKLLARQSDGTMSLIHNDCRLISVNNLIAVLHSSDSKLDVDKSFSLAKTASCGFLYRHPQLPATIIATSTSDLMRLSTDNLNQSIKLYSDKEIDFPKLAYTNTYRNVLTELHFAYNDDEWKALRIKNASFAEINFLYSILIKYGLIDQKCPV